MIPNKSHHYSRPLALLLASSVVMVNLYASDKFSREGFERAGAAGIGSFEGKQYSITHLFRKNLHRFVLWSSVQTPDGYLSKIKELEVLEVLLENPDLYFVFGENMCKRNGVFDSEIICLVKPSHNEFQPALKAWKVNRRLKRFESISPKSIEGKNEGFGA